MEWTAVERLVERTAAKRWTFEERADKMDC